MSTTRRAVLAAPIALTALPSAAVPHGGESCLARGLKLGQAVKAWRAADSSPIDWRLMDRLSDETLSATSAVLAAPVSSIGDIAAKLVVVLGSVNQAYENDDAGTPCEEAAAGLRECLIAISQLTGVSLEAFGSDFFDRRLRGLS
jgi:hypothetical protein